MALCRIENNNSNGDDFDKKDSDPVAKVMVIKNRHGLCEDLKYVISVPELCDVTFLVGPEKLPVYGVKAILATRSRHLFQLLLAARQKSQKKKEKRITISKALKKIKHILSPESNSKVEGFYRSDVVEKLTVEIKNFDAQVFERFMRYVHCGTVAVNVYNVVGLMNAGHTFDFPELRESCWDFALQCIKQETLPTLLATSKEYVHFKTTRMLLQKAWGLIREMPDMLQQCPELYDLAPPEHACTEFLL